MKKKLAIIISVLMATTTLIGCGKTQTTSSNSSDTIKIGVFEPLTGANAGAGQLEVEGLKLANELYPEVLGKKVELVIADTKSDKVEAANAASRLIEKDKVPAMIGCWSSSQSMAAGDVAKKAKIPVVGTACTNPLVTKGNEYYFRVCFIDPFQGTVMADYAFNKLKAKKAAIIQEVSNDYAVGLAKFFTDAFKNLTGDSQSIIALANYNTGDQDFSAQLTDIKSKNPDVIFAPGNFTEAALVIKQARQLGITCPIIGGDSFETPEFLKVGGDAVEGSVFSTFFDAEKPLTKETEKFLAEYKKKNGDKEPAAITVLAYDAYILLLDSIKRTGSTDSEKIREELAKTKDFQGAAGVINFDEDRNAIKAAIIKEVKDGKFKYLDVVEPKK